MSHHWTWDKLVKNMFRLRKKQPPHTPRYELNGIIPFIGTKSCLVKLSAWGVTQNALHQVTMLFNECEILAGNHPELSLWEYFKVEYKGETYYVKKFDKLRNPLTARCSCRDYFFTWAYWCLKAGCLYGPIPRPYVRKTTTYPPRNPLNIPGTCKHLYNAWDFLKLRGFTKN